MRRAVHYSHVLVVKFARPLAERLCAVAVAADDASGASAVVAVAGENLIHQRPHLIDNDPKRGNLQACDLVQCLSTDYMTECLLPKMITYMGS